MVSVPYAAQCPAEETVMEEYTWSAQQFRLVRCVGRHPLVRNSDRLEAWVVLIAALVAVLTVPFAAAIGTATHDQQVQVSVRQAAERHTVAVTATADSALEAQAAGVMRFGTPVHWSVGSTEHTGCLEGADRLRPGDQATLWVNNFGEQVGPPLSREQATMMAIATAALAWLVVVAVLYTVVRAVRWHLDRIRYAEWTREWQTFDRDDNGRRKNGCT
jgi:hypothetical protein